MTEFRADLHCHTSCSDGSDTPLTLLELAKSVGLSGLSITDHDTISAYTPELFEKAESLNLQLLTGIELSTTLHKMPVHILGYGFDLHSESLLMFIEDIQNKRRARNGEILDKLKEKMIFLPEEELSTFEKSIGRPHIAELLVKGGHASSFRDAFNMYLKEGASCYVSGFKAGPIEAIEAIHKANGKAVLAHPHFTRKGLLRSLLALQFDGIECFYGTLNSHDEKRFLDIAKQKKWIATGGSDYHGAFKPQISLGSSWVDEAIFRELLSSKLK